jgi:transcriptional/translational regulatory protein YebC/TACO1
VILVSGAVSEDDVMMAALDAGADDITDEGGHLAGADRPSIVYDVKQRSRTPGSRCCRPSADDLVDSSCR